MALWICPLTIAIICIQRTSSPTHRTTQTTTVLQAAHPLTPILRWRYSAMWVTSLREGWVRWIAAYAQMKTQCTVVRVLRIRIIRASYRRSWLTPKTSWRSSLISSLQRAKKEISWNRKTKSCKKKCCIYKLTSDKWFPASQTPPQHSPCSMNYRTYAQNSTSVTAKTSFLISFVLNWI
jgi:hypothetical protein